VKPASSPPPLLASPPTTSRRTGKSTRTKVIFLKYIYTMKSTFFTSVCAIGLICIISATGVCQAQVISTFAGNGMGGVSTDGVAATATKIGAPGAITTDREGNVFFATSNYKIKKVDNLGIISTIAGNGIGGYSGDGGPATNATIGGIWETAIDTAGIIYIADHSNNCVRSIDKFGIINIFAGTCDNSFHIGYTGDGGPATAANFYLPSGVAADRFGNVYISDMYNNVVRKVHNGIITTFAGTGTGGHSGDGGPALAAQLRKPIGLAVDSIGNVYISDSLFYVRKVDISGIITTVAGFKQGFAGDGGPAISAKIDYVGGLAIDNKGNLYICDQGNRRVRIVNASGIINTYAGTGVAGYNGDGIPANTAQLNTLNGVAVDNSGCLYIADGQNYRVRKVTAATGIAPEIENKTRQVFLYPNPADKQVSVIAEKNGQLLINDIVGRRVLSYKVAAGKNDISLPAELPQGLYHCKFIDEHNALYGELELVIRH
jgi:hypothetical protein